MIMTPRRHRLPSREQTELALVPALWGLRRLGLLALGIALAMLAVPASSAAHVDIDVGDGQYVMEIGFRDEPAYLGLPNALFLQVGQYGTGGTEPVRGLAATLTAEVTKDGQTRSLPLEPQGRGVYEAALVPTATGDYTFRFRISGTIGEATVDESVTSGPSTFNSVAPLSVIEFPVARSDPAQAEAVAAEAQAAAATARLLGLAGSALGLLGLIVGGVALARSGRAITQGAEPVPVEPTGNLIR